MGVWEGAGRWKEVVEAEVPVWTRGTRDKPLPLTGIESPPSSCSIVLSELPLCYVCVMIVKSVKRICDILSVNGRNIQACVSYERAEWLSNAFDVGSPN